MAGVGGKSGIPNWVPETARCRIIELRREPRLDSAGHALLDRITTYNLMKTDVWKKLPREPAGMEGQIIDALINAVAWFSALVPKPGRKAKHATWLKWSKILHEHPPGISPSSAALTAVELLRSVNLLKSDTSAMWHRLWQGDPSMTPDKAMDVIEQLCFFYDRMAKESQVVKDRLPSVKSPFSKRAPQVFFTEYMSQFLKGLYGRPLDSIAAALTQVVFDVPNAVAVETIRGRRRRTRPDKSGQKLS